MKLNPKHLIKKNFFFNKKIKFYLQPTKKKPKDLQFYILPSLIYFNKNKQINMLTYKNKKKTQTKSKQKKP